MVEYARFPDIEAIAARALRDAGVCGGRCYGRIPADNPTYPVATVTRLGGTPSIERWLDSARIQVDVWGEDRAELRSEADDARLALHDAEGTSFAAESGFVTSVQDEMGLTFLPDVESGLSRYTFAVAIHAHTTFTT